MDIRRRDKKVATKIGDTAKLVTVISFPNFSCNFFYKFPV
jgi:hypothetical protein